MKNLIVICTLFSAMMSWPVVSHAQETKKADSKEVCRHENYGSNQQSRIAEKACMSKNTSSLERNIANKVMSSGSNSTSSNNSNSGSSSQSKSSSSSGSTSSSSNNSGSGSSGSSSNSKNDSSSNSSSSNSKSCTTCNERANALQNRK